MLLNITLSFSNIGQVISIATTEEFIKYKSFHWSNQCHNSAYPCSFDSLVSELLSIRYLSVVSKRVMRGCMIWTAGHNGHYATTYTTNEDIHILVQVPIMWTFVFVLVMSNEMSNTLVMGHLTQHIVIGPTDKAVWINESTDWYYMELWTRGSVSICRWVGMFVWWWSHNMSKCTWYVPYVGFYG